MPSYRMDRITEDIKRELILILREVKDPRVSELLSIVKVDVSSDLSYAKELLDGFEAVCRKEKTGYEVTNNISFLTGLEVKD